jgi:hypothetical protein
MAASAEWGPENNRRARYTLTAVGPAAAEQTELIAWSARSARVDTT